MGRVITLMPRLAAVAEFVLPGLPMADIGTDHAYLPAHLVEAGKVPWAIAADVIRGPLEQARSTVEAAGVGDRVQLRMGNGLRVLEPGEVATATICGMGGLTINEILTAGPLAGLRRLVLQPNLAEDEVRGWLAEHGWRLVDETLAAEGRHIYVVLVAEPGAMQLSPEERFISPLLRKRGGPLLARYVQVWLERSRTALVGAQRASRPGGQARIEFLTRRIAFLEEVMRDVDADHR